MKVEAKVEICMLRKTEIEVTYKTKSVSHGNAIKVHVAWAMGVSNHKQESASSLDYRALNLEVTWCDD